MQFFQEVYEQFMKAESEIVIMPYFLKPDLKIFSSVPGQPPDTSLGELIVQVVKRRVHVWLMGWDNIASEKFLPFHQDTLYERLFEAAGEDHEYLHLILDTGRALTSSVYYIPHIKSYVFDRKVAFVGGIDFGENRLDTPAHVRPDPRLVQVDVDDDHMTGNEKPWEDVMVRVDQATAEHVAMVLVERWWTYCRSEGYLRSQASRPLDALADALWGIPKSFHASLWKSYQCAKLPPAGKLGVLDLKIVPSKSGHTSSSTQHELRVPSLKLQSKGLPESDPLDDVLVSGSSQQVVLRGLRGLDRDLPDAVTFSLSGVEVTTSSATVTRTPLPNGDVLESRWLPNGFTPEQITGQTCRLALSGDRSWLGVSKQLEENYGDHIEIIRTAKRFVFIENQYFSTNFHSDTKECAHANIRGKALLYSGATNQVGQEILNRIKEAARARSNFSIAVVVPLGTEPGSFYPNLRGTYCFEQTMEAVWQEEKFDSDWRDYFGFYFLANAVEAPPSFGGPGTGFYGIFTHTKIIVGDDEAAVVGSANINDRSMNGDRDAEVGVLIRGGAYPRQLRETILDHQIGDHKLIDPDNFVKSLNKAVFENAKALDESTGIKFPEGTYTRGGVTQHLFGLKGVKTLFSMQLEPDEQPSVLEYPDSRVVAGGGGLDTFKWFVVPDAKPPKLHGLLFPWSRAIWGLPQMTSVTQAYSGAFNWRRLSASNETSSWTDQHSQSLLV